MYVLGNTLYFEGEPVAHVIVRPGSLRDRFEAAIEDCEDIEAAVRQRLERLNKALQNAIGNAELTSR